MLPLLITGIAGVAGYNALDYFQRKYPGQVYGLRPLNNWRLQGPGVLPCDVENSDDLKAVFDQHQFASVLNCAGSCALRACELDPAMAWRINVAGIRNLLELLQGSDTRLVHLSVDLVYSGTRGGKHIESDWADPVSMYGKTMTVAERLIQLTRPDACQLRISLPMGVSFNGHAGAIDWIESRFKNDRPATLYFDEVRTPTYVDCLTRLCESVLRSDMRGLYHAGGTRRLSLYQIAQIVNRVGGYNPDNLMGCYRLEAGPIPPRAGDVTMDSNRLAKQLGFAPFQPWPRDDALVPTHREWHRERASGEVGSRGKIIELLY